MLQDNASGVPEASALPLAAMSASADASMSLSTAGGAQTSQIQSSVQDSQAASAPVARPSVFAAAFAADPVDVVG